MVKNVKPRIMLDERMLEVANKFYSSRLADNALNRECFSHPDMDSHICNLKARLDGGEECTYCNHIFRRRCYITCDIHNFCLAVYAYRLGIGDEDLGKAIKVNLAVTYNKLHADVMEATRVEANEVVQECGEAQDIRAVRVAIPDVEVVATSISEAHQGLPIITVEEEFKVVEELPVPDIDIDDGEYLTVQEAAELFECTGPNIYAYINRGILEKHRVKGKGVVRRADILELKATKGTRKKKDAALPESERQVKEVVDRVLENAIIGLPSFSSIPSSNDEEKEYLNVKEAAVLFGCSQPNMSSHIARGNLERLEVDGKKVVRRVDVLKLKTKKRREKKERSDAE